MLSFQEFLATHDPEPPLPMVAASQFPAQRACTPLEDGPPYHGTIESALTFIETEVDPALVGEAKKFLKGGVVFKQLPGGKPSPYGAIYRQRTIYLYNRLFDYGCLEDIISTLVHELVHVVQESRHVQPGLQPGERHLSGGETDRALAELEADGYQFHVSRTLGLPSAAHISNIVRVNNARRRSFNAFDRSEGPDGTGLASQ